MPTLNHLHTFRRVVKRKDLYKCMDKYCTYVAEKKLIQGKAALCNKCGEELVLDAELLRLAEPACINCRDTKDAKLKRKLDNLMHGLGVN